MNFKHLLKTTALTAILLIAGKVGWGQVLLKEDFSYASASALTANGWTAHSGAGTNTIVTDVAGLAYTSYEGSNVGLSAKLTTSGEDDNKAFTSQNSGKVYLAFMVKVTAANTAGDYAINLCQVSGASASGFYGRVFTKRDASNNLAFGISKISSTVTYTSFSYALNTTYLLVAKYTFNTGTTTDDVAELFINPVIGNPEPTSSVSESTGTDATALTGVALRQGNATNAPTLIVDGIRVATSWADLLPSTDVTAPTWTASFPSTTNLAPTSVDLTVNANEAGTAYYVVLPNAATAPTSAQVVAGTDATDTPVTLKGNVSIVTATTSYTASITSLTNSTSYDIYVVAQDDEGTPNLQASPTLVEITTPAPDVTAPSWTATYPKTANVANNDFDLLVNIDEIGKVYYVVLTNDSPTPSASEVKNGTATGVVKTGNINITTASTEFSTNISGLSASTPYDIYAVAEDAAINLQASASTKVEITTTSVMPEPTNHVTGLGATTTSTSITVNWTDAAAGTQTPDNYLVVINTDNDFTAIVDGTAIANDTDFADNEGALNIAPGAQTATFNGLTAGTTYYVSVFSYTNSGASINYKTDGTVPSVSKGTPTLTVIAPNLATERYYANAIATITWTSTNMDADNVKIEVYARTGSATWAWSDVVASTPNDGSYDYTIPAAALYGTQYKIRITGLTSGATDESNAAYKVIAVANDIAALKANFDGDTVKLAGQAIISFIRTANRNQKYIQDGTGGMLIDDSAGKLTGTWNIGDGITGLEGGLTTFTGLREFIPNRYSSVATSTGNTITPIVIDYATFAANKDLYESRLIRINNLTFSSSGTFASAANYNTTDGTNTLQFRTFKTGETNIIGTTIPTVALDIIALAGENSGTLQIYSRTLADFISKVATVSSSVYTVDGGAETITNIPYAHNLATFEGNITPATGATFETYQADGTTVAADLQTGYKLIVTAQDGITKKTYTITRVAPAEVATLNNLTSGGTQVPGFVSNTENYSIELPYGTNPTAIPAIVATTTDANATTNVTFATDLAGNLAARTTTIVVTAENTAITKTYTIVYTIALPNTDNTLSDLKVAGTTIVGFLSTTTDYTYQLPVGTTATPAVTATTSHATATTLITPASDVTSTNAAARTTTIEVTAQDGSKKTYKIEFNVAVPGSDATLTGIKVDDVAIAGFNALTETYNISLAANTTVIPTVTATTNDLLATKVITPATNLTGTIAERTTTIEVTAQDNVTKKTYSVVFYVKSGDATLSNLKYNTTQVPSFDRATLAYNVELPYGSTIPTIEATKNFSEASVNVVNATNLKGTLEERTATITVTAEDVTISKVYTIVFTVVKSTDATLSDLKYNGTTVTDFSANTLKYFVTLPSGASVPTVSATKNNVDATISITQATDLASTLIARTATVLVTAESGATKTYSIVFRVDNSQKELFFSEYIEGNSNNKAIEIFNPNSTSVDLSAYTVKVSTNGAGFGKNSSGVSATCSLPLSGTLAAGDVFVIYNSSAVQAIKDKGDLISPTYPAAGSNVTSFNGNDALALYKGETLIDVFGIEITTITTGFDIAGTSVATVDHTIVRKPTVTKGNTDWTASAGSSIENSEWIVYNKDEFAYLGSHNMFLTAPAITTDKNTLPDFGSIVSGTTSTGELSFVVGGVYITENLTITAPAGFEISKQSGTNFVSESPITLVPASGIVAPTNIYVKFHPTAVQTYSANITIENADVPTKNITVTGTGIATDVIAPSFITGYPTFENVGPYTLDVKVKIDEVGFVYFHKVAKDATAPTEAEIKAQGTMIDAIAANTEYKVTVTGLTDNTAYDFYFIAVDKQAVPNTSSAEKKQVTTASIPVVTIHDIQYTTDVSGDSPKKGQWVTTSGIVSAVKSGTTAQDGFYIQDAAGAWNGIYVYTTTPVTITDKVSVTGTVIEYVDAKTEISSVTNVTIISQSNPVYAPVNVTTLASKDEMYESVLVKVSNATCASGSNGSFVVNDGSGDLTVYKGLFADLALVATKRYDIIGIIDDYKPITGTRMYEIYPRNLGDITEITTGINDNFNSNITVYPNPFTNVIRFNGAENVKHVIITSISGQVVKNEAVDLNNSINTSELNNGMYFVTFINDKGEKATKKMIKQ